MMNDWQLYIALVLALAIGFFLGWRQCKKNTLSSSQPLPAIDQYYFKGLNFLLNEEPDAAIGAFIQALEVNSETLETHLALGNLLRKRGEVDRAIRIHQNLLARPGLNINHVQQVQYELATDFVKAGLFDRAESLLVTLVKQEGEYKVAGLTRLLEIYQSEKEWQQGLEVLQTLSGSRLSRQYERWASVKAHFCCELAEECLPQSDYPSARQWLKQSLSYDKENVRASLLLGRVEFAEGCFSKSVQVLKKTIVRFPEYISILLPVLSSAYSQLGQMHQYKDFLLDRASCHQEPLITIELSSLIAVEEGEMAAAEYLSKRVIQSPSGTGLHKLLDYYLQFSDGNTKQYLLSLKQVMNNVINSDANYQCTQCGFKAKELHWLCPSCQTWGNLHSRREG